MHYIPIPEGDPKNNIDASEDANEEKVSLHVTNFVFKCLAVDGNSTSRAIFKLAEDIYEGFKPTIAEMMPSRMFPDQFFFDQVPEFPFLVLKHSIAIFKRVNDTKLPGLEWNAEQLELSVDWKVMYCKYFGEEDACRRELHDAARSLLVMVYLDAYLSHASFKVRGKRCEKR